MGAFHRRQRPYYGLFGDSVRTVPPPDHFEGRQIVHVLKQSNLKGFFIEKHECDKRCLYCEKDFFWITGSAANVEVIKSFTTCTTCLLRVDCLFDGEGGCNPNLFL